jgi:hypothetical protein
MAMHNIGDDQDGNFVVGITVHHNIFRWDHLSYDSYSSPHLATNYDRHNRYDYACAAAGNELLNSSENPFRPCQHLRCDDPPNERDWTAHEGNEAYRSKSERKSRSCHNHKTNIKWIELLSFQLGLSDEECRTESLRNGSAPHALRQLLDSPFEKGARKPAVEAHTTILNNENLSVTWAEFEASLIPVLIQFKYRMGLMVGLLYMSMVFLFFLIPITLLAIGIAPYMDDGSDILKSIAAHRAYILPSLGTVMFALVILLYLPLFLLLDLIVIRAWVHNLIHIRLLEECSWRQTWLLRHGLEVNYVTIPCHNGFCGTLWTTSFNPTYIRFSKRRTTAEHEQKASAEGDHN